jgi:molecular chaperone GrpE
MTEDAQGTSAGPAGAAGAADTEQKDPPSNPGGSPEVKAAEGGKRGPEEIEAELKELKESRIRIAADFDNYRRRTRREIEDARDDGKVQVLKELLPVFDNLERALSHAGAAEGGLIEGVRLTMRQLYTALERFEIKPIDAKGKAFDPQLHEAIQQVESAEPAGTVVEEFQRGYSLGKKLLRPALVSVSKGLAAEPPKGDA